MREVAAQFEAAGIADARLDARILIGAATGVSRERMLIEPERVLLADEAARLGEMVRRRLAREPVMRILGERQFYGRPFEVTPDTLDPRPDTETLIELALEIVDEEGWREKPIGILDIGTGTGCILLTLLAELPMATGVGLDVSAAAVEVARRNARRHGLEGRVRWQVGAFGESNLAGFDLGVSNPPYIPSNEIPGLDPEVAQYDPPAALDGGADGLDIVRQIVGATAAAPRPLAKWLVLEIGAGQAEAVGGLIEAACGALVGGRIRSRKDLGGHTRCVAWKPQI